ncbi:MAG TPA: phosphotransferase family protein [Thermoanaerobaculia bacterium]|nr:phosphotransferase family protein [Thermoanaerobaculia bacterium]
MEPRETRSAPPAPGADERVARAALGRTLEAALERRLGPCRFEGWCRLAGGASQETWSFNAVLESGERLELVLRRAPGGRRGSSAVAPEVEAAVQRAMEGRGVPVASVRFVLDPEDGLGAGYVMDRLPGESIARRILRDPELAAARSGLARRCGEILARIHATPVDRLPELPLADGPSQLEQYRSIYESFDEPRPLFDVAFRRLRGSLPPAGSATLVHGDFRNGNLLVDATGVRAVLDWELAHRGDPMEDLGWLCVSSWRFGEVESPVGGFGSIEELVAGYRAAGGGEVDRERVRAWQVFGTLKWGVMCMVQALGGGRRRAGGAAPVEKAAIGRRVSETEADLARLLGPPGRATPEPAGSAATGHGPRDERPTALELVESARAFLLEELRPELDDRRAFEALVAANALGIVARELELGPVHDGLERAGTIELLGGGPELAGRSTAELARALVRAVRSGALDARDPRLLEHLRRSADRKLSIDNPRYRPIPEE